MNSQIVRASSLFVPKPRWDLPYESYNNDSTLSQYRFVRASQEQRKVWRKRDGPNEKFTLLVVQSRAGFLGYISYTYQRT